MRNSNHLQGEDPLARTPKRGHLEFVQEQSHLVVRTGPHRRFVVQIPTATRAEAGAVIRGFEAFAAELLADPGTRGEASKHIPIDAGLSVEIREYSAVLHFPVGDFTYLTETRVQSLRVATQLIEIMDGIEAQFHLNEIALAEQAGGAL